MELLHCRLTIFVLSLYNVQSTVTYKIFEFISFCCPVGYLHNNKWVNHRKEGKEITKTQIDKCKSELWNGHNKVVSKDVQ